MLFFETKWVGTLFCNLQFSVALLSSFNVVFTSVPSAADNIEREGSRRQYQCPCKIFQEFTVALEDENEITQMFWWIDGKHEHILKHVYVRTGMQLFLLWKRQFYLNCPRMLMTFCLPWPPWALNLKTARWLQRQAIPLWNLQQSGNSYKYTFLNKHTHLPTVRTHNYVLSNLLSYEHYLIVKIRPENIEACMGFKPMTSVLPVQCCTN